MHYTTSDPYRDIPISRQRVSLAALHDDPDSGLRLDHEEPIDGAAESISALADALDRDYRTVHDVSLLADYGLLFIVEDGQAKRPYLPYERIHLYIELVGRPSGEEPAPV
ncbi:hypothetical protein [Halarchaeum salinum]|uniref:Halobacterial output domain-containing protein n=1 Tax=Halarchaeum salinum TaxID=489912 RepID=A0AAV3S7D5_9EURY